MNNSNKVMIVLVLATTISASSHIYARVGFFHIAYAQPINQGAQLGLSPLDPPRVAANGERLPDDQPHRHTSSTGYEGNNSDERQGTGASSDSNTNDNKDKSTIATATTHDSNNPDQNINTASSNSAEARVKQQQPYTGILPSNR